ncbi:hypothetical protein ETAA8_59710 [Anatilimnocola aggregata]|uniref:Uncharacterized protein n=1 Tax=Anatilimnocola aggregata TaxID=2528021 RepID=A0A517YKS2_9BACT|nr:hypothetical protein [Anatilimnocola aggregata]QDU30822.1 hypothetical protein ETAA8_59710 [Anatilimnocola aggregata]
MYTTRSAAPIFAAILLLVPVIYVGSYLALVNPPGSPVPYGSGTDCYRAGKQWSARIFWPLEQMDRKARPGAWRDELNWQSYPALP